MDVFQSAFEFMDDNAHLWETVTLVNARNGIFWQIIAMARVSLNSVRTAASRQKFCEESASWPTLVNGDPRQYVDAMKGTVADSKWSWVDPEADPLVRVAITEAVDKMASPTNVEDQPDSAKLVGRVWIDDIPA